MLAFALLQLLAAAAAFCAIHPLNCMVIPQNVISILHCFMVINLPVIRGLTSYVYFHSVGSDITFFSLIVMGITEKPKREPAGQ